LALHWFDAPDAAIAEWYRVIRPRGLLMFTSFGVDTLAELRAAGSATMPFPDLHDIGDSLVAAGFADPVMDVERLVVRYERPERLLADLRALGGDALRARRRGLATARDRERLVQALRAPLSLTFEIVYGHAWCGERKKLPDGLAPIEFQPRLRRAGPARGARAAVAPARAVVAGAFCRSL
ncbi:MAG TPA: hypothetical protein VM491_03700, partial [Burkholderiaceae bacterium]|nr:hypothetical protein [Burkholderiaceae bacterium]